MKFRTFILLSLAVLLLCGLCGCSLGRAERMLDAAEEAVEDRLDAAEDAVENAIQTAVIPIPSEAPAQSTPKLTKEQAEAIALEHAGFTADQVTYLRTEYEIDDRVPQYEVQFHQGRWEYDYEINANTGEILSYDRDD